MTTPSTTPPQVAHAAAIPDALPLHELTLIGLFSGHQGAAALLRGRDGQIKRVEQGDQAFGYTIAALDDTTVLLVDQRGASTALELPQD